MTPFGTVPRSTRFTALDQILCLILENRFDFAALTCTAFECTHAGEGAARQSVADRVARMAIELVAEAKAEGRHAVLM